MNLTKFFTKSVDASGDKMDMDIYVHLSPKDIIKSKDMAKVIGNDEFPYVVAFKVMEGNKEAFTYRYCRNACSGNYVLFNRGTKLVTDKKNKNMILRVEVLTGSRGDELSMVTDGTIELGIGKGATIYGRGRGDANGYHRFDSIKESADDTCKLIINEDFSYEIVGLGADRFKRVLDKRSPYYGKLFSEVDDVKALADYQWSYRKKRCIDVKALDTAIKEKGGQGIAGTTWRYGATSTCF